MLRYIFTIVFCLCLVQSSTESKVSLTAEPGIIREGLTDTLTLTCSLQDVSISENPQASTSSSTQFDVEHVNSIIVFRGSANDETPVARIIRSNSAEALADEENLQVTGDLNPAGSTDPKFLEMVWRTPRQQQGGQYTCEVYALDMLGRGVVLKANADVKSEVPNIQELITQMIKLEEKTNAQEQTINGLEQKTNFQEQTVNELEKKTNTQEQTIDQLEQKTNTQEQTINELEQKTNTQEQTINEMREESNIQEQTINEMKSILKPPHTEQGVVYCPNTDNWVDVGDRQKEFYNIVQFQKPYVNVPMISVGVVLVDVGTTITARYRIKVTDVSITGFKITCGTWYGSIVYGLKVRWTSIVD